MHGGKKGWRGWFIKGEGMKRLVQRGVEVKGAGSGSQVGGKLREDACSKGKNVHLSRGQPTPLGHHGNDQNEEAQE